MWLSASRPMRISPIGKGKVCNAPEGSRKRSEGPGTGKSSRGAVLEGPGPCERSLDERVPRSASHAKIATSPNPSRANRAMKALVPRLFGREYSGNGEAQSCRPRGAWTSTNANASSVASGPLRETRTTSPARVIAVIRRVRSTVPHGGNSKR